ncbi:hypothetical protein RND81_01G220600 [Saponaria officinalis]|uniref:ZF-HD dimerization-type domain-containing protein n=1 Tax=Saponaria officinalis TaxID=3572 RepID=A0AAW1NBP6_SAPOF
MEFEDEHDNEEHEEEEEDDDEITIPPPAVPPSYVDSVTHRVNPSPSPEFRRSTAVRYRECLKNHAVNIGGHALDGCGEFMPAGDDGTLDALKCAACNCHRNFHRKEHEPNRISGVPPPPPQPQPPQFSPYYRTPAPPAGYLPHHHRQLPFIPALPSSNTSGGTQSGDVGDDVSLPSSSGGGGGGMIISGGSGGGGGSAKIRRHRTKFTQEQKDKMLGFAEKLGWRIQKHDEAAVQQFCAETLVKRQVLKVWMHNNKHTLGKKP